MKASAKKFLERAAYVVLFAVAMLAVRTYRASRKPLPGLVTVSAEEAERTRKKEEFHKKITEFEAKEARGHAERVKRLGEAGAKAEEDRCDAELMAAFRLLSIRSPT
jgi:hypothetical protein